MNKINIKDLCQIALFSSIICIISQLSIPMPAGVPITLQTFIIPLAAVIMGTKKGTISCVIYIVLGAIGAPVFAGMVGGLEVLFGKTGGFIISFPLLALFSGVGYTFARKALINADRRALFYSILVLGLTIGAAINYLIGTIWFSFVTGCSVGTAFVACVLPFIPTALIKIAMVAVAGPVIRSGMVKSGVIEASI